jgi:hypothetical protein
MVIQYWCHENEHGFHGESEEVPELTKDQLLAALRRPAMQANLSRIATQIDEASETISTSAGS